jgi:hypothetical protein
MIPTLYIRLLAKDNEGLDCTVSIITRKNKKIGSNCISIMKIELLCIIFLMCDDFDKMLQFELFKSFKLEILLNINFIEFLI